MIATTMKISFTIIILLGLAHVGVADRIFLKNGNVLEGEIEKVGDKYQITTYQQMRLLLPLAAVELVESTTPEDPSTMEEAEKLLRETPRPEPIKKESPRPVEVRDYEPDSYDFYLPDPTPTPLGRVIKLEGGWELFIKDRIAPTPVPRSAKQEGWDRWRNSLSLSPNQLEAEEGAETPVVAPVPSSEAAVK